MASTPSHAFLCTPLPWPRDIAAAAAAYGGNADWAWLDSAASSQEGAGGYSLIARRPTATLSQADGHPAELRSGGRLIETAARAWDLIGAHVLRAVRNSGSGRPRLQPGGLTGTPEGQDSAAGTVAEPITFGPGWIGYFGFELVDQLEQLPAPAFRDLELELLRLAFFPRVVLLDHGRGLAFGCETKTSPVREHRTEQTGDDQNADRDWLEDWTRAARCDVGQLPALASIEVRFTNSRQCYERNVARACEYITAGDIYQVNLSQRIELHGVNDLLALHLAARAASPAPYAAFLRWDGGAVSSLSPELFLRLRGANVLMAPIKGTRRLTGDPRLHAAARAELIASAKDAAELAMIVDLHRNDLGRVAAPGSVRVLEARRLEAHATVLHTVAYIEARLRPDATGLDLLRACFPAGSVTGVPKIRAMEIIRELESVQRGVYTGAIGHIGLNGDMTLNVAIRTAQMEIMPTQSRGHGTRPPPTSAANVAYLHVGGGIVADSDPAAEYEETLTKAEGFLRAIGVTRDQVTGDR